MISIAEADIFHRLCRDHRLDYRRVYHHAFRTYHERTNHLANLLDTGDVDEEWGQFSRMLRRYRFDLSAAPLAFNNPSAVPRMDSKALTQFVETASISRPRIAESARRLVDLLNSLTESGENPLLENLTALLSYTPHDQAGVVVAESRLVRLTAEALQSLPVARGLEVRTADALRRANHYDLLVVIGPARWFPDHVFNAPRADRIVVISYSWLRSHWLPTPSFLAPTAGRAVRPPSQVAAEENGLDGVETEFDWSLLERRVAGEIEIVDKSGEQDLIQARLYALVEDYAVFLEATGHRTNLVIDLDGDEDDRVAQVADADIEPGMFIVLRNDDSGDYLVPVANKILGHLAGGYRAQHARWKNALRDRVRREGLEATSRRLIGAGSERGETWNLRNWISERNIAPQDKSDFAAIARLVGMGDQVNDLWRITLAIRGAHVRAGAAIRRQLVAKVRTADLAELEAQGRMDFELPDIEGGRLTAFRIEGRSSSTRLVPSRRLERQFRAED